MTSNEILKADVLDILFEHRNKQYGAYALRRTYNNRLLVALGTSLAAVLAACLLIRPADGSNTIVDIPFCPVEVTRIVELEPPVEPVPPPAAQAPRPIATVRHTNNIQIVAEVQPDEVVPEVGDLVDPQIGTVNQAGDPPAVNRTIEVPPAPPATGGEAPGQAPGNFVAVERMPEYPGGVAAWTAFLSRHLRMPGELDAGERRTVLVKFWVDTDGSIGRFEVVQSAGAAFDGEVIRVMKKMPKWKPAIQNGQPIAITFTQPVTFQAIED